MLEKIWYVDGKFAKTDILDLDVGKIFSPTFITRVRRTCVSEFMSEIFILFKYMSKPVSEVANNVVRESESALARTRIQALVQTLDSVRRTLTFSYNPFLDIFQNIFIIIIYSNGIMTWFETINSTIVRRH